MKIDPKLAVIAVASRSFSKHEQLRAELSARFPLARFNDSGGALHGESLVEFLKGATYAITALEKIDEHLLEKLPELRGISKYGVGLDMLDFAALKKREILLGWSGGVNRRSVAELSLTFVLLLLRRLHIAQRDVLKNKWGQVVGEELTGKTIGLIGFGHVGREFAQLLIPFKCKILAYDILNGTPEYQTALNLYCVKGVSLSALLSDSDLVSLHLPLTSKTQNSIGATEIALMKKGARLINTSRGSIVDEDAVFAALNSEHLSGAAFDVFANEPPTDRRLIEHPHFFGTPHIGGSTSQSILAMGRAAIANLTQLKPAEEFESWF